MALTKPAERPELASIFWPTTLFTSWFEAQQQQLQFMLTWQQGMAVMQNDLYDRWSSHFADSARIND